MTDGDGKVLRLRDWTKNDMVLDWVRDQLRDEGFHGSVVLHVKAGAICNTELNRRVPTNKILTEEDEVG